MKIRRIENPVPPMTAEMGNGWEQPPAERLTFFEVATGGVRFVSMSDSDKSLLASDAPHFETNQDYGKMWLEGDYLIWLTPCVDRYGRDFGVAKIIPSIEQSLGCWPAVGVK